MGEVITVDFPRLSRTRGNWMLMRLCDMLEQHGLCEDDILEVLDGIRDLEHYKTMDGDCQRIVDIWHQHTANL